MVPLWGNRGGGGINIHVVFLMVLGLGLLEISGASLKSYPQGILALAVVWSLIESVSYMHIKVDCGHIVRIVKRHLSILIK